MKMKTKQLVSLFCCGIFFTAGAMNLDSGKRKIRISQKTDQIKEIEIIVSNPSPLVRFAASELADYLNPATGRRPVITSRASGGGFAIYLGDGLEAREAGIKVEELPEEGFAIRRKGNRMFIAGVDSGKEDPARNFYQMEFRRGTLSGVYSFLERFAGARFYFPGEMGTLIPFGNGLLLPLEIDIVDRPDIRFRSFSANSGAWFGRQGKYKGVTGYNLNLLRLRMQERRLPLCHGLSRMDYHIRFRNHPEFFARKEDGSRYSEKDGHGPHYCFSSRVTEEIYQDVKAYFTGKSAAERGLKFWSSNAFLDRCYANIMPGDWFYVCTCGNCLNAYGFSAGARSPEVWGPGRGKLSNTIWQMTADIANRLKKEKIPGTVCQMAYMPYDLVPPFQIPDNVLVIAAAKGPGSDDSDVIDKWVKKTNGRIGLWTYNAGKHMTKNIRGIPALMHGSIASYYGKFAPSLLCSFLESETDHYLFNALNYYIYSKIMWDCSVDAPALLEEFFDRMFGKGASQMREVYDRLEACWVKQVIGKVRDTPLGPVVEPPSSFSIWTEIYSPAFIAKLENLCTDAEKAAAPDENAQKRVRFMRRHLLGPVRKESEKFFQMVSSLKEWHFTVPDTLYLRPLKGDVAEVETKISVSQDSDSFIFSFDCEEPKMDAMLCRAVKNDEQTIAAGDSCVEIILNPNGDRANCVHIAVNANGAVLDRRLVDGSHGDNTWNSHAKVKTARLASSWTATVSIPKEVLGNYNPEGFPVNFARQRVIKNLPPQYYHWSPLPGKNFHEVKHYGVMLLRKKTEDNLVANADFAQENPVSGLPAGWSFWREDPRCVTAYDRKVFLSGGKSLYLKNCREKRVTAGIRLNHLKPDTDYILSFYARTRNLTGRGGAGVYLSFSAKKRYPQTYFSGTMPWTRFEYPVRTGKKISDKETIGLWIWFAEGEAWFDRIAIKESAK